MKEIFVLCGNHQVLDHWKRIAQDHYKLIQLGSTESLYSRLDQNPDITVLFHVTSLKTYCNEVLEYIRESALSTKIFMLSNRPNYMEGKELLEMGCKGYGNAHMASTSFLPAVSMIENGNVWLYPEFVQELIRELKQVDTKINHDADLNVLSAREKEIAKMVASGHNNKEIATSLGIKERTVKAHLTNIFQKLNIRDRLSLAMLLK